MDNIKIPIHKRNLEVRKKALQDWKISSEDKKDLIKFLDELEMGKINKGRRISKSRQLKYLDILRVPLKYFNKPSSKLIVKDMERFEKDLSSGKIKSNKKKPYTHSTKVDIRVSFKTYLKWKLGDNDHYRSLTDWLDTRDVKKTPDYLSEEQVEKIYKKSKSDEERFFIAVLFDSGARAEEFHNIRYEDIQLPTKTDNFVKLTIKAEYSKTEGRTICLYWKHTSEAVKDYLEQREAEGIKAHDVVFNNSYDNMRQFLHRLGKKVLKKSIHYHLFRHSSATFYSSKLNRQQLCYRYGWKFSSDMPDVYISRAGMENKELNEKFDSMEINKLRKELQELHHTVKIILGEGKKTFLNVEENIEKIKRAEKKRGELMSKDSS